MTTAVEQMTITADNLADVAEWVRTRPGNSYESAVLDGVGVIWKFWYLDELDRLIDGPVVLGLPGNTYAADAYGNISATNPS